MKLSTSPTECVVEKGQPGKWLARKDGCHGILALNFVIHRIYINLMANAISYEYPYCKIVAFVSQISQNTEVLRNTR